MKLGQWKKISQHCVQTVSYTHLDVYKRQIVYPEYGDHLALLSCSGYQRFVESLHIECVNVCCTHMIFLVCKYMIGGWMARLKTTLIFTYNFFRIFVLYTRQTPIHIQSNIMTIVYILSVIAIGIIKTTCHST